MALKVWWYGRVDDVAIKGTRRRKPSLKKMYAEVQLQADVLKEALAKKW